MKEVEKHPLHKKIGELLQQFDNKTTTAILLDEAAGGKQQISLFAGEVKNRENCLCKVDAMIVQNNKIKVVVEIEETKCQPTTVCGKYLTTALSKFYQGKNNDKHEFGNNVIFIQIISAKLVKTKEKKEQLQLMSEQINKKLKDGSISQYELFIIENDSDCEDIKCLISKNL